MTLAGGRGVEAGAAEADVVAAAEVAGVAAAGVVAQAGVVPEASVMPAAGAVAAAVVAAVGPAAGRMPTGIAGLDHLLDGGVVRGNSLLIEGPPGSGKSTLGVRIVHEGIVRHREPGLIITFEEFPRQIYGEAMQCGIDLRAHEAAGMLRVVWTPPARILQGLSGKSDLIDKIVQELGVRRLLVDSITHFKRVATSEVSLREALATVLCNLKLKGINALLIKEIETTQVDKVDFEEYLVDASLRLHDVPGPNGGENVRLVEIRKTRGQGHVSGRHPFELGREGIAVHPRLRPADVARPFAGRRLAPRHRVPTGVPGLDAMLCGGPWSGTLNLVAGPPGAGKTVTGLHFLDAGVRAGQRGVLVSLHATPEEVLSQAESTGRSWRAATAAGRLRLVHFDPTSPCVEKLQARLLREVAELSPERLVFDSLDGLGSVAAGPDVTRNHLLLLAGLARASGTTVLVLAEDGVAGRRTGGPEHEAAAACVLRYSLVAVGGRLRRFVSVRKFVGSEHASELREHAIDGTGMRVLGSAEADLERAVEDALAVAGG